MNPHLCMVLAFKFWWFHFHSNNVQWEFLSGLDESPPFLIRWIDRPLCSWEEHASWCVVQCMISQMWVPPVSLQERRRLTCPPFFEAVQKAKPWLLTVGPTFISTCGASHALSFTNFSLPSVPSKDKETKEMTMMVFNYQPSKMTGLLTPQLEVDTCTKMGSSFRRRLLWNGHGPGRKLVDCS